MARGVFAALAAAILASCTPEAAQVEDPMALVGVDDDLLPYAYGLTLRARDPRFAFAPEGFLGVGVRYRSNERAEIFVSAPLGDEFCEGVFDGPLAGPRRPPLEDRGRLTCAVEGGAGFIAEIVVRQEDEGAPYEVSFPSAHSLDLATRALTEGGEIRIDRAVFIVSAHALIALAPPDGAAAGVRALPARLGAPRLDPPAGAGKVSFAAYRFPFAPDLK